jgi:short-subunit dehydrogenase
MSLFRPVTLITGASSGIGAALAKVFAQNGHEVALVARRDAQLASVADAIASAGPVRPHVIAVDLARSDAPARIAHELLQRGLEPAIIVNNAGFGLAGPAVELDRAEQLVMIDVNVRALTDLSLRWIDTVRRHGGGVMNVASVASFFPGPHMAVYYATKAYVLSFTEALHHELKPQGLRATALCPGPVKTGFQDRAGMDQDRLPWLFSRSAEKVARAGYAGFMAGRAVVVPGSPNRLLTVLPRLLPRATLASLIGSRQRQSQPALPEWQRSKQKSP